MLFLSADGTIKGALQLLVVLIIFVVVLFLTYYTTRWIAGYQKKHLAGGNVEIIETAKIGTNKYLEIVHIGKDRYYVIAVGKDEVTLVGEISKEDLVERRDPSSFAASGLTGTSGSFSDVLKGFRDALPKKKNETETQEKDS